MINDAVAIILFKVVGSIFDEEITQNGFVLVLGILGNFILTVVSSLLIGGGCGNQYLIQL